MPGSSAPLLRLYRDSLNDPPPLNRSSFRACRGAPDQKKPFRGRSALSGAHGGCATGRAWLGSEAREISVLLRLWMRDNGRTATREEAVMWKRTLLILLVISIGAILPLATTAQAYGTGGNQGSGPGEKRPACCVVEDVSAKFGCSPVLSQGGSSATVLCGVFAMVERLICGASGSCTVSPPPPPPPPYPY